MKIFVINPGSTSTKIALYEDEKQLWVENIQHTNEWLSQFSCIYDQLDARYDIVEKLLIKKGVELTELVAVVARGGLLPPVRSGAYEVNEAMLDELRYRPRDQHASNLGAPIAYRLAERLGIKAYIYDPVTVDEMIPIVRITGLKECKRCGRGHNLNMRAAAFKVAQKLSSNYYDMNIIVAHLGGGITFSLHSKGRIIDMISDDEGAFSPERAGGLPGYQLIDMAMDGRFDKKSLMAYIQRKGGLMAHFGTSDTREIEKKAAEGDEYAALVYEAMALNVAKNIAKLSVVVNGQIDCIVLTGGIAYSKMFTTWVEQRVRFIAPVEVIPGENEMESLTNGVLRVLRGEEKAFVFDCEDSTSTCNKD